MKSIVVGQGEIGQALHKVLGGDITDKTDIPNQYDIIHIAFSYSDNFISEVKRYQELYKPRYTVIHSTVPIGTTRLCQAFHSPIEGLHPHLEESLKAFVKYLAPSNQELKEYFEKTGIKIRLVDRPENTEAIKLWSTAQYGLNIILEKEIYQFCQDNNLDFKLVYEEANRSYNEGYKKLGFPQFTKYILKHIEGKIGGHCVIPNAQLLKTIATKYLLKQNKIYEN